MDTIKKLGLGALKTLGNTFFPGTMAVAPFLAKPAKSVAQSFVTPQTPQTIVNPYGLTPEQFKANAPAIPNGTTSSPVNANAAFQSNVGVLPGVPANAFRTGNEQLDAFLGNLPGIKEALGIGVETPEQKAQRETQTATLNRLLALQENMLQQGAPSNVLSDLDRSIQDVTKALRSTEPGELLKSTPSFQNEGITQGQLLRESAAKADPIARTLSDLVASRSILAEQETARRQLLSDQMTGVQNILNIQEAIAALAPDSGLPEKARDSILTALVNQSFQDPLDRQLKLAQLENLQRRTANIGATGGVKLGAVAQKEIAINNTVKQLAQQALFTAQQEGGFKGVGGLGLGSLSQFGAKQFGFGTDASGQNKGQDMRNLIGNIKGAIALARGGTSFTENEQRLLDTYTPGINESDASIRSKLTSLIQFIDTKNQNIELTAAGQTDILQGAVDEYLAGQGL